MHSASFSVSAWEAVRAARFTFPRHGSTRVRAAADSPPGGASSLVTRARQRLGRPRRRLESGRPLARPWLSPTPRTRADARPFSRSASLREPGGAKSSTTSRQSLAVKSRASSATAVEVKLAGRLVRSHGPKKLWSSAAVVLL